MASDQASFLKLVKLHTAMVSGKMNANNIKNILDKKGDINYKIPNTGLIKAQASDLAGCTILHLACRSCRDMEHMEFFNLLLDHGASITIKNPEGRTAIHDVINNVSNNVGSSIVLRDDPQPQCIDRVLSAHPKFRITTNPVDPNGLSHFHAACMMNNVEVIEFFLDNGVSVQQSVNIDSPIFAGYTPLHFATKYVCLDAVKLLLQRGANAQAKDVSRTTPLHVIVSKSARVSRILSWFGDADKELEDRIDIIERLASSDDDNVNVKDHFGLTRLHVLCAFKDSSRLERHLNDVEDVNCAVNSDSPICPGFTPLHFAALFNLNSVKPLLAKGADFTIKDADENTPLDLCVARYGIEDIHDILACSVLKDVVLSDGKTKLTDLIYSMRSLSDFKTCLGELGDVNVYIPVDSPLWSGYALLHLLIYFHEKVGIDEKKTTMFYDSIFVCLVKGGDVGSERVLNCTPLHLAFQRRQFIVIYLMMAHHRGTSNVVDENGLSHLHIACAASYQILVEESLANGADVNCKLGSTYEWHVDSHSSNPRVLLYDGSTPLHIAVVIRNLEMVMLLLRRGADLQARDVNGMTAVHRLIASHDSHAIYAELLSSENLRECVVDGCGLSHLHVACHVNHLGAVKKLLFEPGTEVNRAIRRKRSAKSSFVYRGVSGCRAIYVDPLSLLRRFDGFTPLHMAMRHYYSRCEIVEVLLQHGADVLASGAEGSVPLYKAMRQHSCNWRYFAELIRSDKTLRRRVFERVAGLTDLHLACYERDLQRIGELLTDGADVNARICDDSPVWSGSTPLHVLMRTDTSEEPDTVLQFLLDKGADVTVSNARNMTPLHMSRPKYSYECDKADNSRISEYCSCLHDDKEILSEHPCDRTSLMIRSIKDFTSNPVNNQGISQFHIACWCLDVAAVEGFLKHGVDVNAKIDYFADKYGGYTPLHVTLTRRGTSPRIKKIVELLLKHGAKVRVQSYSGNTPLHYAADYAGMPIFKMIFNAGGNVNAKNVDGATPLEILLRKGCVTICDMEYFIKYGFRINDFNCSSDEGLIPIIIQSVCARKEKKIKMLLLILPDIGGVDKMGRNGIHNIVSAFSPRISERDYISLIAEFEKLGIDIDDQDKSGRTALHTAVKFGNYQAITALLAAGADINIIDGQGKTAYVNVVDLYGVQNYRGCSMNDAISLLTTHVSKLQLAGIHVSAMNRRSQEIVLKKHDRYTGEQHFGTVLDKLERVKIGSRSLTVCDILSETGDVRKYSKMTRTDRDTVAEYFESVLNAYNDRELDNLRCLIKLQYRNLLMRSNLVEAAKLALNVLASIPVPDLISGTIFASFENWELRNVIEAVN